MNTQDLNEVSIVLDHLTLLRLKMQQLDQNKPRPKDYSEQWEKLYTQFETTKDELVETLISKNWVSLVERTQKASQNTDNQKQ